MRRGRCAYCGSEMESPTKDHVVPGCLFPSKPARVNRPTVPACHTCNESFTDDEAHFRNVMVTVSGSPPAVELRETVLRSLGKSQVDGLRRLSDLWERMEPVTVDGRPRHIVLPGNDERVVRVVRKIIRGFCHRLGLCTALPDGRVRADVLKHVLPAEWLELMETSYEEAGIVRCRHLVIGQDGIHSVWLLTFYDCVCFVGVVLESEEGPAGALLARVR